MENRLSRRCLLALLAGAAAWPRRGAAAPVFPADHAIDYLAEAQGAPAGTHRIAIARGEGSLVARSESRLLLPQSEGAPLPFEHFAEETWRAGWLQGLVADTRLGDRRHRVRARRRDGALRGTRDGHGFAITGYLMTASGWHRDTPQADGLVDAVDGRLKRVRGARRGWETVETGWGPVEAERWTLVGELPRELWYDEPGHLIRFALPAPGGAVVATAVELEG